MDKRDRGFTLLECVIALSLSGLLLAVVSLLYANLLVKFQATESQVDSLRALSMARTILQDDMNAFNKARSTLGEREYWFKSEGQIHWAIGRLKEGQPDDISTGDFEYRLQHSWIKKGVSWHWLRREKGTEGEGAYQESLLLQNFRIFTSGIEEGESLLQAYSVSKQDLGDKANKRLGIFWHQLLFKQSKAVPRARFYLFVDKPESQGVSYMVEAEALQWHGAQAMLSLPNWDWSQLFIRRRQVGIQMEFRLQGSQVNLVF